MAIRTFNYPVQVGVTANIKADINIVQFNDGYSQRTKRGLNNTLRKFNVVFKTTYFQRNGKAVYADDVKAVEDFLNAHEGYKAFLWTSFLYPNNKAIKVYCPNWSITYGNNTISISMEFQEVVA